MAWSGADWLCLSSSCLQLWIHCILFITSNWNWGCLEWSILLYLLCTKIQHWCCNMLNRQKRSHVLVKITWSTVYCHTRHVFTYSVLVDSPFYTTRQKELCSPFWTTSQKLLSKENMPFKKIPIHNYHLISFLKEIHLYLLHAPHNCAWPDLQKVSNSKPFTPSYICLFLTMWKMIVRWLCDSPLCTTTDLTKWNGQSVDRAVLWAVAKWIVKMEF